MWANLQQTHPGGGHGPRPTSLLKTNVPKDIRYPIFLQPLVSNVLDLEIEP
jgi:hypothetical protein